MRIRFLLASVAAIVACACGADSEGSPGSSEADVVAGTVDAAAVRGGCSTDVVRGLAEQLVAEVDCMQPGALVRIDGLAGVTLDADVFPYLQQSAADALRRAGARGAITINSALRTTPQQYLLHRWYTGSRCGIGLAAPVGASNHEQGLAVDAVGGRSRLLVAQGFHWFGSADPVHHDYSAGGDVDLAGLSTKAFQRLWNRNHPEDLLVEDGVFARPTELRLRRAPAHGFDLGARCEPAVAGGDAGVDSAD